MVDFCRPSQYILGVNKEVNTKVIAFTIPWTLEHNVLNIIIQGVCILTTVSLDTVNCLATIFVISL